ncbi:hypothetical protein DU002_00570 [Corallincola holothuriorum]|uniref:6-carboxy-5,6,7,8-tetrahydropterin synthase n=1 Tax=Corallincola holothuriorum TaxID=2282215 RepID=A0A368NQ18_9GAMM|nr:6-carboxytetrahydropterin synthase [Corallincola holothuriorum]RCU52498.1 hypothetical protein DU002_00570 [Corallincola holothuriorum]
MRLFVDGLTVIDSTFLCAQRGMLGESWIVDVELAGELNDEGMLFDFSHVKKTIKHALDATVDHKLIVPEQAAETIIVSSDNDILLSFKAAKSELVIQSPLSAFAILPLAQITDSAFARYLEVMLLKLLPDNVTGITVHLRHEAEGPAFYHYTHGLKKHDGNCQRIAHGHRSRIGIWLDGEKRADLESNWASRWQDIYLGSADDEVSVETLPFSAQFGLTDASFYGFQYSASQGNYYLAVSKSATEIVDCDTTVECLADYIARQLSCDYPEQLIKVRAYEGVEKGAICEISASS